TFNNHDGNVIIVNTSSRFELRKKYVGTLKINSGVSTVDPHWPPVSKRIKLIFFSPTLHSFSCIGVS
ncbi:hypothetical protein, partial [Escherichia coli]